jgi:hypothetical protein
VAEKIRGQAQNSIAQAGNRKVMSMPIALVTPPEVKTPAGEIEVSTAGDTQPVMLSTGVYISHLISPHALIPDTDTK